MRKRHCFANYSSGSQTAPVRANHRGNMFDIIRIARRIGFALLVVGLFAPAVSGMEHVTFRRGGEQEYVDGRIILQAQDGGLLFLGRDGLIWRILPTETVNRTSDAAPFHAYPKDELVKRTLADLPKGFNVQQTKHYMIFYNGSNAYAVWCRALFERLFMAFQNDWTHRGFELTKPEFPLVAVVFADKPSYVKYSEKSLGNAADSIIGYYEPETTNRIIMYDLASVEGDTLRRGGPARGFPSSSPIPMRPARSPRSSTRRPTRSLSTAGCTSG